jgi:hypothetical protein
MPRVQDFGVVSPEQPKPAIEPRTGCLRLSLDYADAIENGQD